MDNLRSAIGFLTRIPIATPQVVVLSNAAPWFPVVGVAIGLAQAAVLLGFNEVLPSAPAAVLAVAIAALITGAFHHDGLADMADAFGGGWTVEQRLEIMKDSRLGTYGSSALILAFAAEISVLASVEPAMGARAVIAGHCLSRAIAVVTMRLAPLTGATGAEGASDAASPTGSTPGMGRLGAAYAQDLSAVGAGLALAFALVVTAVAFAGWQAVPATVIAVAAAIAVVALSVRKIGGITGDVLGAVQQLAYLGILLVSAGSLPD